MKKSYPLGVVGGGLVGLTAALRLAEFCKADGKELCLVAPKQPNKDQRTTAMLMPTVELLQEMGIWNAVEKYSAPLRTMRLIDGSSRLIRAPLTEFKSAEIDQQAFGYNVPNAQMSKLLETAIAEHPAITRYDAQLASAQLNDNSVGLTLDDGREIDVDYAIAADGRHSMLRETAGIHVRNWSYPQSAIVLNFTHTLPHDDISTEFHTQTGPFTQVPLPPRLEAPHRSSLVWVVKPEDANRILRKSLEDLSIMVEEKLYSMLGKVVVETEPQSFPLEGMTAEQFAKGRIALVGEAAHVIPPIGAQGFNLGMRDLMDFADTMKLEIPRVDYQVISNNYRKKRINDVNAKTFGIDVMNRSLLTDFLPVQALRATGMSALKNIPWLRQLAMKQGLGHSPFSAILTKFRGTGPQEAGPTQ